MLLDVGEPFSSVCRRSDEPGSLRFPTGLATHGGEFFVADSENHRVAVYSEVGCFARSIGGEGGKGGQAPGMFNEPEGLTVAHGCLVVSEAAGCRLQVLTLQGTPLQVVTPDGSGRLAGVCCSADGNKIFVEDFYLDTLTSLSLAAKGRYGCAVD